MLKRSAKSTSSRGDPPITRGDSMARDESANALVGGERSEPVDAAGAGQSLELVLTSIF
jgi:hypothetical protein